MLLDLSIHHRITIQATPAQLWDALINPAKIKQYLYGTEAVSDWQAGASIVFQGEYEGQAYRDHGIIQEFVPEQKFSYTYWTQFSALEDKPENYALVSFEITPSENACLLSLSQKGFVSEEARQHSDAGWPSILEMIAKVAV
ncbi:MAG: SRPBCC domain-containing protein [Bacteroidota bacterium]